VKQITFVVEAVLKIRQKSNSRAEVM